MFIKRFEAPIIEVLQEARAEGRYPLSEAGIIEALHQRITQERSEKILYKAANKILHLRGIERPAETFPPLPILRPCLALDNLLVNHRVWSELGFDQEARQRTWVFTLAQN